MPTISVGGVLIWPTIGTSATFRIKIDPESNRGKNIG
jgi:hypothetical protein